MHVPATCVRHPADAHRFLRTSGSPSGPSAEGAGSVLATLEAGVAQERNRLAREIHDTLAQGLSATALHLEVAEALLEDQPDWEPVRASVRRALETTRQNLDEVRRSVLDLRAAPLEGRTLAEALEELCIAEGRGPAAGARVEFRRLGPPRPIPAGMESALYRVAQEALSNARRHARAGEILVELDVDPQRIRLSIADDGEGFDPTRRPDGRFGLMGMRERMRLLGGRLLMRSRPGTGTSITAFVPLA